MSLNKIMLIGNVGQDPEVKHLQQGNDDVLFAGFSLAASEKYNDRNGERHERTEWFSVECWRNKAELVQKYVQKGTQLYVEGKLRTRSYQTQSGEKKYVTYVEPEQIQLLGNTRKQDSAAAPVSGAVNAPRAIPGNPFGGRPSGPAFNAADDDSDLPDFLR